MFRRNIQNLIMEMSECVFGQRRDILVREKMTTTTQEDKYWLFFRTKCIDCIVNLERSFKLESFIPDDA